MESNIRIKNKFGDELDTLVEGNQESGTTIILVHGFGVDKNESFNYFTDFSLALKDKFRIMRFDFSGYGKSTGKQEDVNYQKQAGDLNCVIEYVKTNFPGKIFLLAHSMGAFVTSLLSPDGVERAVLTGIPNSNTNYIIERLKNRIGCREGASVDTEGITIYPRTSGEIQKIGASFWKSLRDFDPIKSVSRFSKKTSLLVIHFTADNVVGSEYMEEYNSIPNIKILWLPGDHSARKSEDREVVIKTIKEFFTKR